MARGVNKAIILGNLGKDPDVRFTQNGSAVANFTVATSETWTDKQTGQRQEKTEWHSVVMFNKLAEIAQQYLKKGSKVYIEGKLQTRKWQDNTGQDRYTTEILANDLQMLDSAPSNGNSRAESQAAAYGHQAPQQHQQQAPNQQHQQHQQHQQQNRQPNNYQQQSQGNAAPNYGAPSADQFNDEIPF